MVERGQTVPECCKVGQVKMVLFLSTIAGRSQNTDNQISAVVGSRIMLPNIYNIRYTSLLSSYRGFTEDQREQSMVASQHSVRDVSDWCGLKSCIKLGGGGGGGGGGGVVL